MNCWLSGKYVHLLYMYSILGRGSFCFNYCLNSAWHGGDQFVALLRWYGSPGFFDSGLQLICIFLVSCFSFFSWQYPTDSWIDLLDDPHKAAVLSVGWESFSSTLFPSTQLSVNMLGYSTLWTASLAMNVCGLSSWIYLIHEFHNLS